MTLLEGINSSPYLSFFVIVLILYLPVVLIKVVGNIVVSYKHGHPPVTVIDEEDEEEDYLIDIHNNYD